jgi:hypothetical protein
VTTVNEHERMQNEIARRLSRSRFIRAWGKCEIFLGLTAAGAGLLLGCHLLARPVGEVEWGLVGASLALIVLGGYLALAGHRGHLYQAGIEQTAFLLEEIRCRRDSKEPS